MNSSKSDASAEDEKELRWSPLGDGGGEKTRREEEAKTTLITREHFHNSALSYFDFLYSFLLCPLSTGICHDMRDLFPSAARWSLTNRQRLRSGGPLPCTVQPSPEGERGRSENDRMDRGHKAPGCSRELWCDRPAGLFVRELMGAGRDFLGNGCSEVRESSRTN